MSPRTGHPKIQHQPSGYALTCSKADTDAIGGGWCVIRADRIEQGRTRDALGAALGWQT